MQSQPHVSTLHSVPQQPSPLWLSRFREAPAFPTGSLEPRFMILLHTGAFIWDSCLLMASQSFFPLSSNFQLGDSPTQRAFKPFSSFHYLVSARGKVQVLMALTLPSGALPFSLHISQQALGSSHALCLSSSDVTFHFLTRCCSVLFRELNAVSPLESSRI